MGLDIGIAADLRSEQEAGPGAAEDALEEYDSEETVAAIAEALHALGHRPRFLGGGRRLVERLLSRPPELVFNLAEGRGARSREAQVPAVCEMLGVPCTHSDPLTLSVTLDKSVAKRLAVAAGVPTPGFVVVGSPDDQSALELGFPLIAKPLHEGSSIGVRRSSRVEDASALRREVERLLADYREPVLVEEFAPGPEVTVGILGEGASARAIGAMEIAPRIARPGAFVYSLEVKRDWKREVEYHVPPRLARETLGETLEVALDAYRTLGCRDVARVDLRLSADGEPLFIEANPLPGINPVTGDLVILAGRSGLDFTALVGSILDCALQRIGREPCPSA